MIDAGSSLPRTATAVQDELSALVSVEMHRATAAMDPQLPRLFHLYTGEYHGHSVPTICHQQLPL